MTIKEKLENLEYSEVYDLWIEHVYQSAEPPQLWDLIHQLSDLASVDADTKTAILSAIDCLGDEDEETSDNKSVQLTCCKSPIIISVDGGCVVNVENLPSDNTLEIHDYDIQDDTSDNVHTDSDGEKYIIMVF